MRLFPRTVGAAAAAVALILGLSIGGGSPAGATGNPVALGGGSGLVVSSGDQSSLCSLGAIGTDSAGRLIGITAGHCGSPGDAIYAEYARTAGPVGTIAQRGNTLDWAVIVFDSAKVEPLSTVGGTTIRGIGEIPAPGTISCINGRKTGFNCGVAWTVYGNPPLLLTQTCARPGDSGGPVTVGDRLVAITTGTLVRPAAGVTLPTCDVPWNPWHGPQAGTPIDLVLSDIDSTGGEGAGFAVI